MDRASNPSGHHFPPQLRAAVERAYCSPNRAAELSVDQIDQIWLAGYDRGIEEMNRHRGRWILGAYLVCLASGGLMGGIVTWLALSAARWVF